jgi:hypothetical protein
MKDFLDALARLVYTFTSPHQETRYLTPEEQQVFGEALRRSVRVLRRAPHYGQRVATSRALNEPWDGLGLSKGVK